MSQGQNALLSPDLTDGGRRSSGSGLVLGSQLIASALNCGCLAQGKIALLVRNSNGYKLGFNGNSRLQAIVDHSK